MRLITGEDIKTRCGTRARVARHFGPAAPAVELAISTLRAARSLVEFLALPNVNKEDDVIFRTPNIDVHLGLTDVDLSDPARVEVTSVSVISTDDE
jgi:hypothetical protein